MAQQPLCVRSVFCIKQGNKPILSAGVWWPFVTRGTLAATGGSALLAHGWAAATTLPLSPWPWAASCPNREEKPGWFHSPLPSVKYNTAPGWGGQAGPKLHVYNSVHTEGELTLAPSFSAKHDWRLLVWNRCAYVCMRCKYNYAHTSHVYIT